MKTIETRTLEMQLMDLLNELPLYEFILTAFNLILLPDALAEYYHIKGLNDSSIRRIALKALIDEFGDELSEANTRAEKALKKACSYITGLYEALKLRIMLFYIPEEEHKRIIGLLTSNIESNRFGGLRSLRFKPDHSNALTPVAEEVGYFFAELNNVGCGFPEAEIQTFLRSTSDYLINRIEFLLTSEKPTFIHGGLMELQIDDDKIEICKKELNTIIEMVKCELLKRENELVLEEFKRARDRLDEAKTKLEEAGFEDSEISKMLECTNAFKHFEEVKEKLTPDILSLAIA